MTVYNVWLFSIVLLLCESLWATNNEPDEAPNVVANRL